MRFVKNVNQTKSMRFEMKKSHQTARQPEQIHWFSKSSINVLNKNIEIFRVLFVIITILVPLLVGLSDLSNPGTRLYLWDRAAIIAFGALTLFLSYRWSWLRSQMQHVAYLSYYLITFWMVMVTAVNHFSDAYVLGLVAVISASAIGFRHANHLSLFFLFAVSSSALAGFLVPAPLMDRSIFIGSIATIAFISFIAMDAELIGSRE